MYSTREEIEGWLIKMNINNYVINEDLTVDVNESIDISYNKLIEIPVKFEIINGDFDFSNNYLTSLESCPEVINGNFYCYSNNLTSLDFFPKEINGDYIFFDNNKIKEEDLVNFNCDITNIKNIYSDFNKDGNKEEFIKKVYFYKSKKENELLKELSVNSNNIKLNKKL